MEQNMIVGWVDMLGHGRQTKFINISMNGDRELIEEIYEYLKKFKPEKKESYWEFKIE